MKKHSEEMQTLRAGCNKSEPKIFDGHVRWLSGHSNHWCLLWKRSVS